MKLHFRTIEAEATQPRLEKRVVLIALHGLMGSSGNWHSFTGQLAHALVTQSGLSRLEAYLLDLRNHGDSPHHPIMNYSALADDVLEFTAALSPQPQLLFLMGHSMGGKVAMEAAKKQAVLEARTGRKVQGNITHLAVLDMLPCAYPAQERHGKTLTALRAVDLTAPRSRGKIAEALRKAIPSDAHRQFLLKNLVRCHHDEKTTKVGPSWRWKPNLAAIQKNLSQLGEALSFAAPLTLPTLFVFGEQSPYFSIEQLSSIEQNFPNHSLARLPECGHWLQVDQPEKLSRQLLNFFSSALGG